ncbi:hypothetical protein ACE1TI_11840 [Alteribacillus sp. JSM 102045]|uniref:hypothetical protein n=1 Tax=Alteribacillus sp. JSM 102045 TaxID=1562101 RepID=UPI0035C164D0
MRRLAGVILVLTGLIILGGTIFANAAHFVPGLGVSNQHTEKELQGADTIQLDVISSDLIIKTHEKDTVSVNTSGGKINRDVKVTRDNSKLLSPNEAGFLFFLLVKDRIGWLPFQKHLMDTF